MRFLSLSAIMLCLASTLFGADEPRQSGGAKAQGFKNVAVEEFDKLRGDKQKQVLDVRTPAEFAAGHIPGAINIDINGPDFEKKVVTLKKDKTYLVNCAGGGRSARACGRMSALNFTSLYNLQGGFKAWEEAGKAVEK